ncbi:hypothetical protein [Hydrogenimonas sp. SS33]|uniref:hypothetical protein n=1 Tax=Hydrogenimonas leucolamina TaxID=2954236 RepID=UPI00336C17BE
MKKWWIVIGVVLMLLAAGCGGRGESGGLKSPNGGPVTFKPESLACPQCRMPLKGLKDSAQYVAENGDVTVFDDPGCMVLWLQDHGIDADGAKIYVYTRDTKRWIDAKKAYYSQTDATPMGYGFGAYEKRAKDRIGFDEMRLRVLRGLTLKDPKIRKKLLGY